MDRQQITTNKNLNKKLNKNLNKKKSLDISIPSCVNQTLNSRNYVRLFQADGIITIPNFLEKNYAEKYYRFLTQEMLEDWWFFSGFYGKEKVILNNNPENQVRITEAKQKALEEFQKDGFSYFFNRTYNNHFPNCDCLECEFRKICQSPEFVQTLAQVTGLDLKQNNELFLSRYGSNSFLTVHNDKGNGKIAFVLNLTKDWKPQYGGNFHLLSNDRTVVRNIVSPVFNSLTIFKVPEPNGVPHFISHVVSGIKKYRYAVSGWFS